MSRSVVRENKGIVEDITKRIRCVGMKKWCTATGVLSDKKVIFKVKEKFYKIAVKPKMMYGSECGPLNKDEEI